MTLLLFFRVDGDVEKLAIIIAFAPQGSGLAINIFLAFSFIETSPLLQNLELPTLHSKFE